MFLSGLYTHPLLVVGHMGSVVAKGEEGGNGSVSSESCFFSALVPSSSCSFLCKKGESHRKILLNCFFKYMLNPVQSVAPYSCIFFLEFLY